MHKHIILEDCLQPPLEEFHEWLDYILYRGKHKDSYYPSPAPDLDYEHFLSVVKPELSVLKFETDDGEIYSGNFFTRASKYFSLNVERSFRIDTSNRGNLENYYCSYRGIQHYHVQETHDINWEAGEWGDDTTSCWWSFEEKSKGRLLFWHMAKQDKAGALLIHELSENGKARILFVRGDNFIALMNGYGLSNVTLSQIAYKYFGTYKYIMSGCSLLLNSDIYINGGVRFLTSDRTVMSYHNRDWSDYDFRNPELEEDRVNQLVRIHGDEHKYYKVYCPTCDLPVTAAARFEFVSCFRDGTRIWI